MKLFSLFGYCCKRLRQTSRHFAEAIGAAGVRGGINYLRDGFRSEMYRLPNPQRERSSELSEFDRKWGTDTSICVNHRKLGVSLNQAAGITSYSPTDANAFNELIGSLKVDLDDYAFVDCGSGKGLVLLLASRYPFKQIIGVEMSPILHEVAGANLRKNDPNGQRCFNINLQCQDATEYQYPTGPCIVYFYNPFREASIFEKVLANLDRSVVAYPRDVILIYLNPVHIKCLEANIIFERLEEIRFSPKKEDWAVIFRAKQKLSETRVAESTIRKSLLK